MLKEREQSIRHEDNSLESYGNGSMLDFLSPMIGSGIFRAILLLLLIVVATALALRITSTVVRQVEQRIKAPENDFELDQRGRLITLLETGKNTVRVIILTIAALVALATVGIDIGPVLAAAGIAGLALSLGAQMLIKDFLSGLV